MARRNVLLWLSVALAALLVDLALLRAPEVGVSRFVFVPIALAGLVGAYLLGVRKAKGASLGGRLCSGALWVAPWFLLLFLPWGLLTAGYAWERVSPIVPPDGVPDPRGVWNHSDGFRHASTSNLSWNALEQYYTEQLSRRGWRHASTRHSRRLPVGQPPGAPLPRWIFYRRFDGLMLVSLGTLPNGRTAVVSNYMHLKRRFDADHLLRE